MAKTSGRWKLGFGLSLVATLLWGTLPIALKVVVRDMDPVTVVFYRFVIASLLLGLFLHNRGWLPRFSTARGLTLVMLAIAVLGCTGNNAVFLAGLQFVTPSAAQVLIQTAPMFLLIGAVVLFKEPFSRKQWFGFATLVSGLALFFNQRLAELLGSFSDYTVGLALILISAVLWAAFALAQKRLLASWRSGSVMWTIYAAGVVLLLPFASPASLSRLDSFQLIVLVYCGLNTLIGYGCFAEALAHWEASRVSAVVATTPLITVALMMVLSNMLPDYLPPEGLNLPSIIGAGLVVLGSVLAALGNRRKPPELA